MNDSPEPATSRRGHGSWSRGARALALLALLGLLSNTRAARIPLQPSATHAFQPPLAFEVNEGQTDEQVEFLA
jgi:hypothetical protein